MSDQSGTRGGSPLRGADGKLQSRKLAAWISFLLGIGLLVQGSFLPPAAGLESKVLPALVALLFSLLFWGLLTVQNVVQLVALLKGHAIESKDVGNGN